MLPRLMLCASLLLVLTATAGCTALGKMFQVLKDPSIPVGAPEDMPTEFAISIHVSPTLNGVADNAEAADAAPGELEPGPYTVSLSADDPRALTEKVASLFSYLQAQYPESVPADESALGDYEAPTTALERFDAPHSHGPQIASPIAVKVLQLRDDSLLLNSVYQQLALDPAKALRSTYIRDDDYLLSPGQFKFVPFQPLHDDTRFIAVIADYSSLESSTWQQVLRIAPRGRRVVLSLQVHDAQIELKEEDR
ncbi:type VI secretion system lipoprotein TssJ [Pseudomonas sp. NPDC089996]|uniref:type VI secretion system lipoprotein TssJ n=1 Tax=Pseudomonas sp. NPDC089996 TaxID=3364474 RepID=UPI003807FA5E